MRALAYKVDKQLEKALECYKVVMKDETTIWDYFKLTQKKNADLKVRHQMVDPASVFWEVDLFYIFKTAGLLKDYEPQHYIRLWEYFEPGEGWQYDKVPHVLNLLQKLRFFNRFEDDQLERLLTKVSLKTVKKGTLLFLQEDEAAIIVAGQLYLFDHEDDVACPVVQAIYSAGDIIGISEISNGWTRKQNDWIVANNDCDIFICSKEYICYLWHIMKKGS